MDESEIIAALDVSLFEHGLGCIAVVAGRGEIIWIVGATEG